jgi:four helix bundle protein
MFNVQSLGENLAAFKRFEEIEAWQDARELVKEIYFITCNDTFSRDFSLMNQIRKASISVMSNIAEGFEKGGNKEFIQFLSIAKGSVGEVRSQLYIALDQDYIIQSSFDHIISITTIVSRKLSRLIDYLKQSTMKGIKFK